MTCQAHAQPYADRDHYLLDSLDLNKLGASDRLLIDTMLVLYHAAQSDTARLRLMDHLVEECTDIDVWPRYNALNLAHAIAAMARGGTEQDRKMIQRYHSG